MSIDALNSILDCAFGGFPFTSYSGVKDWVEDVLQRVNTCKAYHICAGPCRVIRVQQFSKLLLVSLDIIKKPDTVDSIPTERHWRPQLCDGLPHVRSRSLCRPTQTLTSEYDYIHTDKAEPFREKGPRPKTKHNLLHTIFWQTIAATHDHARPCSERVSS